MTPVLEVATRPAPIRGRDLEVAQVRTALEPLREGRGAVVLIVGPAGLGKTRLLEAAVASALAIGARVARATAVLGHRVVPFAPLVEALAAEPRPLVDRTQLSTASTGPDAQYWIIEALEAALERDAGVHGALAVVVDDLQWADPGTVAAIEVLSDRLEALPIAWVATVRSEEASTELLAALGRLTARGAVRIALQALNAQAVVDVAVDLLGAPPDPALRALLDEAQGVPFWLTELLHGLHETGRAVEQDGRSTLRPGPVPQRVEDIAEQRLHGLSPAAREVAGVASVLGRRFTFDAVQQLLAVPPASLLGPVDELRHAGLLVDDGDRMAFRHDLLREAVLQRLPPSARGPLERQAAEVLLDNGAPPVEVALRLADSARPGDERAVGVLLRAATALASSDPAAAAELTQRTLSLLGRHDVRRGPLVADSALLLHAAGRTDEAVAVTDTALHSLLDAGQESEVRYAISGMFTLSADVRAEANRRALAIDGLEEADRARHEVRLSRNALTAGRRTEVGVLLARHGAHVRRHGDRAAQFDLHLVESGARYGEGRFAEALQLIEAAGRSAHEADDDARARVAEQWRGETLVALDRIDEARQISEHGLLAAQRADRSSAIHLWEQWQGRHLYLVGELADAVATLEATIAAGPTRPAVGANDAFALSALAGAALHLGDRRLVQRCATIAALTLADGTPELRRHATWILAQQAMAEADPLAAHAIVRRLADTLPAAEPVLPFFPVDVVDEPQLTRLALWAGDRPMAERSVALAEGRALLNPGIASIVGAAAHARGLLDDDPVALRASVTAFAAGPRRLALASAQEDAALAMLRRPGGHDEAVALLGHALELSAQLGARWDVRRLRQRLRRLGVRRRLVTADRPSTGWAALTASELGVVRAVTAGQTNREVARELFLSPHTVGSHLRHVFTKLGIASRLELARLAAEHDA